MYIEKIYCNESQKQLSQQLLFEASLFSFRFISVLQYLDGYYNEYAVMQTASLYLKLPLNFSLF